MPACGQHLSKASRQRLSFSLQYQRLALTRGLEVALRNKGGSEDYPREWSFSFKIGMRAVTTPPILQLRGFSALSSVAGPGVR